MPGLSTRYCRVSCEEDPVTGTPHQTDDSIRGLCGLCSGVCQPCESDIPDPGTPGDEGENCGDWQDCSCVDDCGDGHDCHRYIDIEFSLESFVIQGKVCTNASEVTLTQQCDGGGASSLFNKTPVSGTPSGWSALDDGINDYVTYDATVHRIRLTRQDCGCFWGGYWSSSCDCGTCCCTNSSVGDPAGTCVDTQEPDDIYPNCDDCYITHCFNNVGGCLNTDGQGCRACDPSNPCLPIDNGYASSLDTWGTGEVGGSDGEAVCLDQTYRSDAGQNICDYMTTACDSWIDDEEDAYAGWEVGEFKPHHIEAYFTYQTNSATGQGESCNSGWILEIRGVTELSRSEMGLAGGWPAFDCLGGNTDGQQSNGGSAEDALGYRGRWWGKDTLFNQSDTCEVVGASGAQDAIPEFVFHGCSCPKPTDIESTVKVTNAVNAFHPASVLGQTNTTVDGSKMYNCVVSDAQGNDAPTAYCNDSDFQEAYGSYSNIHTCLGQQLLEWVDGAAVYSDGTCYGSPGIWWHECQFCHNCCPGDYLCGPICVCNPGPEEWCTCVAPSPMSIGIENGIYPCSHCVVDSDPNDLNHESCIDCLDAHSHACAPCTIKIRPNSNASPWWGGGT